MINPLNSPFSRSVIENNMSPYHSRLFLSGYNPKCNPLRGSGFMNFPTLQGSIVNSKAAEMNSKDEFQDIFAHLNLLRSKLKESEGQQTEYKMLSKLVSKLKEDDSNLENIEENLKIQKTENESLQNGISQKYEELNYWKKSISELQGKISNSSKSYTSLSTLQSEVDGLLKENEQLNNFHKELADNYSPEHQTSQISSMIENINNLKAECSEINSTLQTLHNERKELYSIIEKSKQELYQLRMRIPQPNPMTQETFRLQYINKSLHEKIALVTKEKDSMVKHMRTSTNDDLLSLKEENEFLKRQIGAKKQEIESIKETYNEAIEDINQRGEELVIDNENLKTILDENENKLSEMKNETK